MAVESWALRVVGQLVLLVETHRVVVDLGGWAVRTGQTLDSHC